MWLFKRKVKRSEWMQGLLDAEELFNDGWRTEAILDEMYYSNRDTQLGAFDFCWFKDYINTLK